MHFIICIAGLPHEAVNAISAIPSASFTGTKGNSPILKSLKEPYDYRPGMSDYYLYEIAKRLELIPPRDDVGIALAYANHSSGTRQFVRNFFPFAAVAPFAPFFPYAYEKHERRSELLMFVDRIQSVVTNLRAQIAVVRDSLSGRNFSPLTLPIRNFRSDVLEEAMFNLFERLNTAEDMRALINQCCQSIAAKHPVIRRPEWSRLPFFQDDRALRFKSPGTDRHGMARSMEAPHLPSCLIKSRARLGGPIDALFHYDCEYEHENVDPSYPNCHGAEIVPAKRTHVNIAPSDAIR